MSLLLVNGKFRISQGHYAEAVAIEDGIIRCVGSNQEVLLFKQKDTEVIDLDGRICLPGFNDSHMHFLDYGYNHSNIDLGETHSIKEAIELIRKQLETTLFSKDHWIQAYGWNDDNWLEKRHLTKKDLDECSMEYPIIAVRVCEHIAVLNSKALNVMGLRRYSAQPDAGRFLVDSNGDPTGEIHEMIYKAFEVMPEPTVEEIKGMIKIAGNDAVKVGLTAVQTDDFESIPGHNFTSIIRAYLELSEEGILPVRVYEQCALPNMARYDEFVSAGYATQQGTSMFKLGPMKLFCDGSLGARTAWLKEDYSDDLGNSGYGLYDNPEQLNDMVRTAHQANMAVAIHCIGDAAAEQAVTAIEMAQKEYPEIELRHGIVHAQILDDNIISRMANANIIAYIQPIFIEYDLHMAESRVGERRIRTSYNWNTLRNCGIHTPFGTDCPVESFAPLPNIYSAVTRKDLNGYPDGGWYPNEALSLDDSIDCYTIESAYASYDENNKGTIAVGKYADLTILNQNIFDMVPDKIKDAGIYMTIVSGKIRWRED